MKKIKVLILLLLATVLVACSNTFEPEEENVEVERVLSEVREFRKTIEEIGVDKVEFDDEMEINISLREFLYNYYDIANKNELQVIDVFSSDNIMDFTITFGHYPYINVDFNYEDDGNHTIRSVACFKECDQGYQDAIVDALKLSELKYDKDYTIEERYEESEDGGRYDVFTVKGK